jgi:hypothetical protein
MSFPAFIHGGFNQKILGPIMQKLRTAPMPRLIYALALASLFCGVPVTAQDTLPDKNGDLSGFRLDTPPPKEKAAEPAPKVEAPIVKPVVKSVAPPVKPVQRTTPQTPSATAPQQEAPATETLAPTGASGFTDIPPPVEVVENETAEAAPNVVTSPIADYIQYWPWIAALLAAALGLLLFGFWKRNRAPVFAEAPIMAKAYAPPPPPPPAETPVITASNLTARFDPADARLSVANLTVKGHLHLRYDGEAPLKSLYLRTRVMSACDGQKALIDAFHSDPAAGQIESLGRVMPGEQIELTLEMQVPRDALQAFDWRERRFVAPIVLINVASADGDVTPRRISCVVGQEGAPGAARLQPIPIDRGPKLFGALQFRPIAA